MAPSGRSGWAWVFLAAAGLFALTALLSLAGASGLERSLYDLIGERFPKSPAFRWASILASGTIVVPALALAVSLLSRDLLRRGATWLTVLLTVSAVERFGKVFIGRLRPEDLRAGFPSGHTAVAAVFCFMVAYSVAGAFPHASARLAIWAVAAMLVLLVGLSRVVMRAHWPLDALGGAVLGLAAVAAAAWWQERGPGSRGQALRGTRVAAVVYRWQGVIPLPLLVALCFTHRLAAEDSLLDVFFDVSGIGSIVAGLLLRLWAAAYSGPARILPQEAPSRLVTAGPYAHLRHPLFIGYALIALGVMLLAESGPGLILMPAVMIILFRLGRPYEEQHLAERFGRDYAAYRERAPRPVRRIPAEGEARPAPVWRALAAEFPVIAMAVLLGMLAEAEEVLRLLRLH